MVHRRKITALAALAALAIAGPVAAQEKRTLKFSQVFAANHWHFTESVKLFEEEVTRLTNGRIQFENYHAGQLSKEGVTALTTGLADFAVLVPSYEPAKLPLTSVAELPGLHTTSCGGTAKLWHLIKDGGVLNNAEYKPQNIKVLYAIVLTPYQVATSKKPVTKLSDLSGMKIRANGAAMDKTVRALGAVPVRVTTPELFDALSRGTIDGGFWPIGSTRNAGLEKSFKYTVVGPMLGGGSSLYGMRQQVWDSLSAQDKAAIEQASAKVQQHLCSYLDRMDEEEIAWLTKNQGFKATRLSAQDTARWNDRVKTIADDWAKEMDSTGRPGSAMLKAFRAAPAK